jgi:hypothetical protein
MLGSSVLPDLLETMQIVLLRSTLFWMALICAGIGGIEHVQLGEALDLTEGEAQHFRAQTGAAHAQQQSVLEFGFLDVRGDGLQRGDILDLFVADGQPPEPLVFVGTAPQRGIFLPQPRNLIVALPVG